METLPLTHLFFFVSFLRKINKMSSFSKLKFLSSIIKLLTVLYVAQPTISVSIKIHHKIIYHWLFSFAYFFLMFVHHESKQKFRMKLNKGNAKKKKNNDGANNKFLPRNKILFIIFIISPKKDFNNHSFMNLHKINLKKKIIHANKKKTAIIWNWKRDEREQK